MFRELIQNSEDAKASKQVESFRHTFCPGYPNHYPQIFLLDCRVHPPGRLSGKLLENMNGPALLAFNNASFRPEDWKGILATYGSSKRMDAS
jgi:sacsin